MCNFTEEKALPYYYANPLKPVDYRVTGLFTSGFLGSTLPVFNTIVDIRWGTGRTLVNRVLTGVEKRLGFSLTSAHLHAFWKFLHPTALFFV
jgi:hypothetical protein